MTSPIRQVQDDSESNASAPQTDCDSVLLKVLTEASSNPAILRRLLEAMKSPNPRLDIVLAEPIAQVTRQARTLLELEQMLQLERTVKRVEQPQPLAGLSQPAERTPGPLEARRSDASDRMPRSADAVGPMGMEAEAPIQGSHEMRLSIRSFLQVCTATVIGVAVFLGISGWVHWLRPPVATHSARVSPPRLPPGEILAGAAETVGYAQPRRIEPPPPLRNSLPFPLPVSYGVYAGSNGQLTELQPLPVEVPASSNRMSAEITKPSLVTLPADKLAFVVFRQNLANDVPAGMSARVVGRVTRATTFVNLKAKVTRLEGSWRIRDKSYELKVSPVDGSREMFVVQPDAVLPAGRYALVLNGYGYDFTVAGPITALEQCLQQIQVTNGILVTECPG